MAWTTPYTPVSLEIMTAAIWTQQIRDNLNVLKTSISNDGATWTGAVAGTSGSFTGTLSTTGGGVFVSASGTGSASLSLQNAASGVRGVVQSNDAGDMLFYTDGSVTPALFIAAGTNVLSTGPITATGTVDVSSNLTVLGYGAFNLGVQSSASIFALDGPFGLGQGGNFLRAGANTSGTGSAGYILLDKKGGGTQGIWVAATGVVRTSATPPIEGAIGDTGGTAVGDQTSWHEAKDDIRRTTVTPAKALATVVEATIYDYRYKGDGYQDALGHPARFVGFVGYDRRKDWFLKNVGPHQEPALNVNSILGFYALSFQELDARIGKLEQRAA